MELCFENEWPNFLSLFCSPLFRVRHLDPSFVSLLRIPLESSVQIFLVGLPVSFIFAKKSGLVYSVDI